MEGHPKKPGLLASNKLSVLLILRIGYRALRRSLEAVHIQYCRLYTYVVFKLNGVQVAGSFVANGRPVVDVSLRGQMQIGRQFAMNSGQYNLIGRQQPCYFIVAEGAKLEIGTNVGISCSALVCRTHIVIGDNVRIGGNTVIYDTDFHSLRADIRTTAVEDPAYTRHAPVRIEENAFIGAHSTILKGVTIGKNSIVGAGSVVSKSIPANQIWAGNPAKFIKAIDDQVDPSVVSAHQYSLP